MRYIFAILIKAYDLVLYIDQVIFESLAENLWPKMLSRGASPKAWVHYYIEFAKTEK